MSWLTLVPMASALARARWMTSSSMERVTFTIHSIRAHGTCVKNGLELVATSWPNALVRFGAESILYGRSFRRLKSSSVQRASLSIMLLRVGVTKVITGMGALRISEMDSRVASSSPPGVLSSRTRACACGPAPVRCRRGRFRP